MADDVIVSSLGAIRRIALNRPQSRNGLVPATCVALAEAIETAREDSNVRAIVLTGEGKAFCSGADLMAAAGELGKRPHAEVIRETFHRLIRAVTESPKPVVAAIRGPAVGFGFDLALACDLRVIGEDAKLGAVFTRIALVPDGGSSFTLSRLVGLGRAKELVLLAETFDGKRAGELGLATRVVADDQVETEAMALAQRLADGPPLALGLAKRNLERGTAGTLSAALDHEIEAQVQCLASADMMEGVSAFFQKRKPAFRGV